ncbi:MAG: sugar phosphate isomerase/epimerase [Euryarchaeota archaeon]|nr:sugar phosphate isomerase/epimerase [Euryarchaeota archaeon]
MNFSVYTLHPGFWSPIGLLDTEGAYRAVDESLREIAKASEDMGVRVALENMPDMPMTMGKTPTELLRMLNGFDMDICFDVGHANTARTIDDFLPHSGRFINVHLHDNRGQRDEHLPIGGGNIDFKKVLRALRGYNGRLVIEARSLPEAEISKERLAEILSTVS